MSGAGVLGQENHTVHLQPRGGGGAGDPIAVISGQASRKKDDTSSASVVVAASAECCDIISNVDPLAVELAVHRGDEKDPWWEGPLCTIEEDLSAGTIKLSAKDLTKWFDLRRVHRDHQWVDVDLAQIFADLINDGLVGGPVADDPGFAFAIEPTGVVYSSTVRSDVRQSIGELLRSLSDRGIDWTMIGRTFWAFRHTNEPKGPELTLDSFVKPPKLRRTADTYSSFYYVIGSAGAAGFGGDYDPYYGLVERVAGDPNIFNDFDAEAQAVALANERTTAPFIDPNATSTLSANALLDFDDLIPGCVFPVKLPSCGSEVDELMRLCDVRVKWNADGEQVQVGMQPVAGPESAAIEALQQGISVP